jgi:high affinity Mn2+ porin
MRFIPLILIALSGLSVPSEKVFASESQTVLLDTQATEEQSAALSPWSIHGQSTFALQWHPAFQAAYTGPNSLSKNADHEETTDVTLYIGRKLWSGAEFYINPEYDQGFGLNNTLGLAGFSSGEAYKIGNKSPYFRLPRAFIRQTIDLEGSRVELDDQANQVAGNASSNNIVITIGKFSVVDIFDTNKYAHDPRVDFLNWSAVDAGAFDYAADAWGFSAGAAVEWNQDWWTLRSGLFSLSSVPNSTNLDLSFQQYQLVEEMEERHQLNGSDGKLKALVFLNKANLGTYQDALALDPNNPDTGLVRSFKNHYGVALNFEQEITPMLGVFAKFSWNDGIVEAEEFTEINQSFAMGLSMKGNAWKRHQDNFGIIEIVNSLSNDAKQYFRAGGMGILIGDGQLNYGNETITEIYYNLALNKNLNISADYQYVLNPAYNKDRGPVHLIGFRVRANF